MKENRLNFKAYYADTDSYGVVWHGAYLRWLEGGRIEFLNDYGISINEIRTDKKIVMPVVDLQIQYKTSAKAGDSVIVSTGIAELKPHYVVFDQTITEALSGKIFTTAKVKCVGINEENGKLIRTIDKLFEN